MVAIAITMSHVLIITNYSTSTVCADCLPCFVSSSLSFPFNSICSKFGSVICTRFVILQYQVTKYICRVTTKYILRVYIQ